MSQRHALVWFRTDLRVADNPALFHACENNEKVSAVYFVTPKQWQSHHHSLYRTQFTLGAVEDLRNNLVKLGIPLTVIKTQDFNSLVTKLSKHCQTIDCQQLYFNYEYALDEQQRDQAVLQQCKRHDINVLRFNASVIIPPGKVLTQQGQPFKVFTPFKRTWLQQFPHFDHPPLPTPKARRKPIHNNDAALVTKPKLLVDWPPTEAEAHKRLKQFIEQRIEDYQANRDLPAIDGTSSLSPYLSLGLLSPSSALHIARHFNAGELAEGNKGISTWINELVWRDFYIHLMVAYPQVCKYQALKPETDRIKWRHSEKEFQQWREGCTGFPLVDAAMRQLNTSGWMHNRLRMVTATFLSKYLLVDWRWGEQYFMEHLVDGHIAANNGGWQWCASTGTDAAPYFRLLSPVRQAERFDPDAVFIKHFLPELEQLPAKVIHQPGHPVLLQTGYPKPMVDLKYGKDRCLQAFQAVH